MQIYQVQIAWEGPWCKILNHQTYGDGGIIHGWWLTEKEYRRARSTFERSFVKEGEDASKKRSEMCPPDMQQKIESGEEDKNDWMLKWYKAGSWKAAVQFETKFTETQDGSEKVRGWMNFFQMIDFLKSEDVAELKSAFSKAEQANV